MLIGLYLVTPFVQKMIKNFTMNDFRNFIIICVLIPATLPIFSLYFNFSFNEYFVAAIFPMYIGYYVAGIYLIHMFINKRLYYMTFMQNIFEFNSYIGIVTIQLLTFVIAGLYHLLLFEIEL